MYVKRQCISAIGDPSALIRATVGLVISMICARGELENWPELLPSLCQLIDSPQQTVCEVSPCSSLSSASLRSLLMVRVRSVLC